MSNINTIRLSGTTYQIEDSNASKTVELTQAQYDALVDKDPNTFYVITDAEQIDITAVTSSVTSASTDSEIPTAKAVYDATQGGGGGITSGEVQTMINESISGKADTSSLATVATSGSYNDLDNKLSAGTGIDITSNVISVTGGTGGKAVSGGTNISITTGETADTINCTLSGGTLINISNNKINCSAPIRNGTGAGAIIIGDSTNANVASSNNSIAVGGQSNTASGSYSHAEGYYTTAATHSSHSEGWFTKVNGQRSHSEGNHTVTNKEDSHAEGKYTVTNNVSEHASGQYNVSNSASTTFGDSGNTLFSVGNGTGNNARHNAFEIRQNGDIYCSDGTNDVKLQDTIAATAANTTALGGLSLVKLTQAEYDALSTKDSNTLYLIVN